MIIDAVASGLSDPGSGPALRRQLLSTLGVAEGGGGADAQGKCRTKPSSKGEVRRGKAALREAAEQLFTCRRSLAAHEWRTGQLAELLTADEAELLRVIDAERAAGSN